MPPWRVLGVDACTVGWVAVAWAEERVCAYVAAEFDAVVARADADGHVDVVGVDMPIGLPDNTVRRADLEARAFLGARRSTVFLTPTRAALDAADHATASRVNQEQAGTGISIQAYGLRRKIGQVERFVRAHPDRAVVEVHPEVSFGALAGGPLPERKATWAGVLRRRALLRDSGIDVDHLGPEAARAGPDDVLDAAVVAWTARRYTAGLAVSRPDPPERFLDGWPAAIWT